MVIGEYPCCENPLLMEVPTRTPAYRREACPYCATIVWHRLSRIEPESWTEETFLAEHIVNEETNVVTLRNPKPVFDISSKLGKTFADFYAKAYTEMLLTGSVDLGYGEIGAALDDLRRALDNERPTNGAA